MSKQKKRTSRGSSFFSRFLRRSRSYFLTGMVVSMPIIITLWIINWVVSFVDRQIVPLLDDVTTNEQARIIFDIPGLGLILALLFLVILGWFATNIFGQTLIRLGERIVDRMPVVRTIYNALKQIFKTIISDRSSNFEEVGLIEYPRPNVYALVFITSNVLGEIHYQIASSPKEKIVSVFLPTTPNPTSGFLLFLKEGHIKKLSMSVEDGIKMVISGGLIEPGFEVTNPSSPKKVKSS